MAGITATYNSNSLQTSNILTDTIDHHGLPKIDAKQYAVAHTNKSAIPYVSYPTKIITLSGTIIGSSVTDCDNQIDTFRSYLTGIDETLSIGYNSTTRNYTATPTKVDVTRPNVLSYAKFSAEFTCDNPFGTASTTTTAWSSGSQTSASLTSTYSFVGTAPYQLPVVTITLTAVSDSSGGYLIWGNQNTGQAIYIDRSWSNGDVLVIDCTQSTVTVNGVATAFSGAFPMFPPGSQTMYYNDSFASRTVTISVVYYASYL